MKTGAALWEWAKERAVAATLDKEKVADPRPGHVLAQAIAEAYLIGANDALLNEVVRIRKESESGALPTR